MFRRLKVPAPTSEQKGSSTQSGREQSRKLRSDQNMKRKPASDQGASYAPTKRPKREAGEATEKTQGAASRKRSVSEHEGHMETRSRKRAILSEISLNAMQKNKSSEAGAEIGPKKGQSQRGGVRAVARARGTSYRRRIITRATSTAALAAIGLVRLRSDGNSSTSSVTDRSSSSILISHEEDADEKESTESCCDSSECNSSSDDERDAFDDSFDSILGSSEEDEEVIDDDSSESEPEMLYERTTDIDDDLERHAPAESRYHKCTAACPFGCRGMHRPSEIIIFEGISNKRMITRASDTVSSENPALVNFKVDTFKRVGGRGQKRTIFGSHSATLSTTTRPKQSSAAAASTGDNSDRMPQRVAMLFGQPAVTKTEALKHTWNPTDRSFNIRMKDGDPFTIRRQPVAQSTDSARGKLGYSSGLHIFEISWPTKQRGTHASVGVSTQAQILHSIGYSTLIGQSEESWGWDLGRLKTYHNSAQQPGIDYPANRPQGFAVPKSFHLVLDCDTGHLAFIASGKWLGIAHSGLKGKVLYPTVSGVWGHCEVTLRYHGGLENQACLLSELCRTEIRRVCRSPRTLPLPPLLKNFLLYK